MFGSASPREGMAFIYNFTMEFLQRSQLYVKLEGSSYGEAVEQSGSGTRWIQPAGTIIQSAYLPTLNDRDALASMKHLSFLAAVLHGLMVTLVYAVRSTARGIWYQRGPVNDMQTKDVSTYIARLAGLASAEAKRLISRWELGFTSELDALFWSDTAQVIFAVDGRTAFNNPDGSRLPHPRGWKGIRVCKGPIRWILVVEKGCVARPLASGRGSLFREQPGGIIISVHGMPGYCDIAIIAAMAASFPQARVFGLFDCDPSGIAGYMSLKLGSRTQHYEEYKTLTLHSRISNCSPIPESGEGRLLTKEERTSIAGMRDSIPTTDPDHDHLTEVLNVGRSATIQGAIGDNMGWISDVRPELIAVLAKATVASTCKPALPGNDERDADFPTLDDAKTILRDLAAVRDFWNAARIAAEADPGIRPRLLKPEARWSVHKRRRSEVE